jgi:hypothetical protein
MQAVLIRAKLTKEGSKEIDLVVHRFWVEHASPCCVIEDGVSLGLIGGHIRSLEEVLQDSVNKHPGFMAQVTDVAWAGSSPKPL